MAYNTLYECPWDTLCVACGALGYCVLARVLLVLVTGCGQCCMSECWLHLSFYRVQPDVSFEAYHRHAARLKQTEKMGGEGGSGRLEPRSPSLPHPTPPHPTPSHNLPVREKRPSEQYYNERMPGDEGSGGVSGDGRGGVGGVGREEGERSGEGGLEGAPISSPAWRLMAKELAR